MNFQEIEVLGISRSSWSATTLATLVIMHECKKWFEAERIVLTDLLYSTLEILNISNIANFLAVYIGMYCQHLWGVFGSDITLFWVCVTHSFTGFSFHRRSHISKIQIFEIENQNFLILFQIWMTIFMRLLLRCITFRLLLRCIFFSFWPWSVLEPLEAKLWALMTLLWS